MKSSKFCLLSLLISSALVGCNGGGGGGGSTITDDTQPVSYKMENIVESFLNAGIDYKANLKDAKYAGELIKYYDQNHEEVDFRIPTNTVTKYGCVAEPIALNNRESNLASASFNVKPLVNGRRLVSFSSLPKSFVNAAFGKKVCLYGDYNYSGNFIIGSSNQKLVELSEEERVVSLNDYNNLSDVNRLFIVDSHTFVDGTKTKLKPYLASELNYSDMEFIVNKDGEVKVFEESTGRYVTLPDTTGYAWQFFSDRYLMSKPHGGQVYLYDVDKKQLVKSASVSVLQNFDTDISTVDKVTLSYGLWAEGEAAGTPFKIVSENYFKSFILYFWDGSKWTNSGGEVKTSGWYQDKLKEFGILKALTSSTDDGIYLDPVKDSFIAAHSVSDGGFDIYSGVLSTLSKKEINDFSNHLEGVSLINGKITVETSDRVLNHEKRAFYFIDGDKKQIVGNPGENITSIEPSVRN